MKPIKGYENYSISKTGEVTNTNTGRVLKACLNGIGYYHVSLHKDGKQKSVKLHRLVAEHFIPNPDNLPVVRHLNDVKNDNRIENLAWGTQKDNMKDKFRNGYKHGARKLNEEQVKEIFFDTRIQVEIAKEYGMHRQTVNQIKRKKIYKEITDVL